MSELEKYADDLYATFKKTKNPAIGCCLHVLVQKISQTAPENSQVSLDDDAAIRRSVNDAITIASTGSSQGAVQKISDVLNNWLLTLIEPTSHDVLNAISAMVGDGQCLTNNDQIRLAFAREVQKINAQEVSNLEPTHIFVAAMPRSASSSLIKALVELTGFSLCPPRGVRVKSIPFLMFADLNVLEWETAALRKDTVGKQHLKLLNNINGEIFKRHKTKVVFQYRNIFDAIISLVDHHSQFPERTLWRSTWETMTYEEKVDSFIAFYAPDYLRMFYTFTKNVEGVDLMHLSYDHFTDQMEDALNEVLGFAGVQIDRTKIAETASQYGKSEVAPNFNKGVKGRGYEKMTKDQRERISNMTCGLRDVDFSPLGIEFS